MSLSKSREYSGEFCLHIPFEMAFGDEISHLEEPKRYNIDKFSVILKKTDESSYLLKIGKFKTKEEAFEFYFKIKAFFLWASIKFRKGIKFSDNLKEINYFEELGGKPQFKGDDNLKQIFEECDAYNLDNGPLIHPYGVKWINFGGGKVIVTAGVGVDKFADALKEVLQFPYPENVFNEINGVKLQLAIDLYLSYLFESDRNARFITLVTVLEALLPPKKEISRSSQKFLESMKEMIKPEIKNLESKVKNIEGYDLDEEFKLKELQRILTEIDKLKKESIKSNMRNYISTFIRANTELGDPDEIAKLIGNIYDDRSSLLHEGKYDKDKISENLIFLENFVPKLLEKLYSNHAKFNSEA